MKKEYSAGIIVFHDVNKSDRIEREYLVLHYRKGHWDLPKGKLEGDETNIQAAERELMEETGLTVQIIPPFEQSLTYIFKDFDGMLVSKEVTFFVGKAANMDVTLSREHTDYQWMPLRDALKRVTYSNAQQLLSMADQFIGSFEK